MKANLQDKASGAVFWSFVDRVGEYGIQALVSIVLARLLMPSEFGLIGMLWIFIGLTQIVIDGGFGQALVQNRNATITDECSVFYFNLFVAFLGVGLLWLAAPLIAGFYSLPTLVPLTRAVAWGLPLSALGLIHTTVLNKRLDLKTQAKAGFLAAVLSGIVAIVMASLGYGVWSLVAQSLSHNFLRTAALWYLSHWRPRLIFSTASIKAMFPFGSRLLSSAAISVVFRNIYRVAIGKLFLSHDLGLYTMATRIPSMLGDSLTTIVSRVILPVYPMIREDPQRYKMALKKVVTLSMIVISPLAIGIAATADPLIRVLLTEKWLECVPYLQLFCLITLFLPLQYANLEALLGLGRSDLYFRLELAKVILSALNIVISYRWGISGLLTGELVACSIAFGLQTYYVGVCVGYSFWEEVRDILPSILAGVLMGGIVLLSRLVPIPNPHAELGFEAVIGAASFIGLCVILRIDAFRDLCELGARFWKRPSAPEVSASAAVGPQDTATQTGSRPFLTRAKQPLVSVLVPAYNAQSWIAGAIRSVQAQTWARTELVVVDDGSTDETLAIARQFASKSVVVVSQPNQGAAAARNKAYSLCQGDYIQWLDADDLLHPEKIARQMQAIDQCYGSRSLLSSPWGSFYYRTSKAAFTHTPLWSDLSPLEWLLRKMGHNCFMQTATWLVSRELTEAAGSWDTRMLGDDDGEYFCRVLLASEGSRFVPEAKVFYRLPGTYSLSYVGQSRKKIEAQFLSCRLHIDYIRSLEDSSRVREACLEFLENQLTYLHPEIPEYLQEAQKLAGSLGGDFRLQSLNWRYVWIQKTFGWDTAMRARSYLPHFKRSIKRRWDKALFQLERSKAPAKI